MTTRTKNKSKSGKSQGLHVQVSERDYQRIKRGCPRLAAGLFSTWFVLLCLAQRKRSLTFSMTTDIVAERVGVSRRQLHTYVQELQGLKMLKVHTARKKSGQFQPTRFTLNPTYIPRLAAPDRENSTAQGHGNQTAQGSALGTPPLTQRLPKHNDYVEGTTVPSTNSDYEGGAPVPANGGLADAADADGEPPREKEEDAAGAPVPVQVQKAAAGGIGTPVDWYSEANCREGIKELNQYLGGSDNV